MRLKHFIRQQRSRLLSPHEGAASERSGTLKKPDGRGHRHSWKAQSKWPRLRHVPRVAVSDFRQQRNADARPWWYVSSVHSSADPHHAIVRFVSENRAIDYSPSLSPAFATPLPHDNPPPADTNCSWQTTTAQRPPLSILLRRPVSSARRAHINSILALLHTDVLGGRVRSR